MIDDEYDEGFKKGALTDIGWEGADGTSYSYRLHGLDGMWPDCPGNYIFAGDGAGDDGNWRAYHIGETDNFSAEFEPTHEKWEEARPEGATAIHIHAHTPRLSKADREQEAQNLIQKHRPPLK